MQQRSLWCCYCMHNKRLRCSKRAFALTSASPACLEFRDRLAGDRAGN